MVCKDLNFRFNVMLLIENIDKEEDELEDAISLKMKKDILDEDGENESKKQKINNPKKNKQSKIINYSYEQTTNTKSLINHIIMQYFDSKIVAKASDNYKRICEEGIWK